MNGRQAKREEQVLATIRESPWIRRPPEVARVMNFKTTCDWAPVGPPNEGEQCASVSEKTRCRVMRVMESLCRQGKLVKAYPGTRMMMYLLPEWAKELKIQKCDLENS